MSFLNTIQNFDANSAKNDAFQTQEVPAGTWLGQITLAEIEQTMTGENSKYPNKQVEYFKFGVDLIVGDRVMSYQERFMVGHELAHTDSFKGLVARGQLNAHNLLEVFGLTTQPISPDQLPNHLVGQQVNVEMGVKKKGGDYPNYIKAFTPANGAPVGNAQPQQAAQQQPMTTAQPTQTAAAQPMAANSHSNVGFQQPAMMQQGNPNPFGANQVQ